MRASTEPREFPSSTRAWKHLKKNAAAIKVQELREKIAKDLQRIRDRKMNATIAPVPPPPDQQEAYFAKLENNGIWEQVFKNVTNLSDITSAYFVSEMFRDYVEKKRISMLLSQVFGVFRNQKYLNFKRSDILNLRQVSKAWKDAAETEFLTPEGFFEPDWHFRREILTNSMMMFSPFSFFPKNAEEVESAMKVLGTSRSLPTLLRVASIDLVDLSGPEKETFMAKLGDLLDVHGKHVWSLQFVSLRFDYKALWNLVLRTSSLKELVVFFCADRALTEDDQRTLLAQFPFPGIPSLTRLSLFRIPVCKLVTAEIVGRNPSLKTLSIRCDLLPRLWELSSVLANLPLECLDFNLLDLDTMTLPTIRPLVEMQWPLRILNLSWTREIGHLPEVPASDFFGILNQFKDTLEEFNVDTMILKDNGGKVVVQFPKLKNIGKVYIGL